MNKICKIYTSEINSFFPVLGKSKNIFFKPENNVNSFCNEADVSTKQELFTHYGMTIDAV